LIKRGSRKKSEMTRKGMNFVSLRLAKDFEKIMILRKKKDIGSNLNHRVWFERKLQKCKR